MHKCHIGSEGGWNYVNTFSVRVKAEETLRWMCCCSCSILDSSTNSFFSWPGRTGFKSKCCSLPFCVQCFIHEEQLFFPLSINTLQGPSYSTDLLMINKCCGVSEGSGGCYSAQTSRAAFQPGRCHGCIPLGLPARYSPLLSSPHKTCSPALCSSCPQGWETHFLRGNQCRHMGFIPQMFRCRGNPCRLSRGMLPRKIALSIGLILFPCSCPNKEWVRHPAMC